MLKNILLKILPEWRKDIEENDRLAMLANDRHAKIINVEADLDRCSVQAKKLRSELDAARRQLSKVTAGRATLANDVKELATELEKRGELIATLESETKRLQSFADSWALEANRARQRDAYIESWISAEREKRLKKLKSLPIDEGFSEVGVEAPDSISGFVNSLDATGVTFEAILCSLQHVAIPKDYGPMMEALNRYLLLPYTETLSTKPYLHSNRFAGSPSA